MNQSDNMHLSLLIIYIKKSIKSFWKNPGLRTAADLIKYYPRWLSKNHPGNNALTDQMPWICFSAIDFLKGILKADMVIFEFGSGGSTFFWSARVEQVISVEHDRAWFDKMREEISSLGVQNIELLLIEPVEDPDPGAKLPEDPNACISTDPLYLGKTFRPYVVAIDRYPPAHFDLILIDGRARPSCLQHAIPKIKEGGYIVLDNAERAYYLSAFDFDKTEWEMTEYEGPVPYVRHFSKTTIIHKKANTKKNV